MPTLEPTEPPFPASLFATQPFFVAIDQNRVNPCLSTAAATEPIPGPNCFQNRFLGKVFTLIHITGQYDSRSDDLRVKLVDCFFCVQVHVSRRIGYHIVVWVFSTRQRGFCSTKFEKMCKSIQWRLVSIQLIGRTCLTLRSWNFFDVLIASIRTGFASFATRFANIFGRQTA